MITPSISTPIDVNTSIYFTASQGYYSYVWEGDVTGTGYQSDTVSFTTPGTYTVSVLICDEFSCCGRYTYTFEVVNECDGVTITSSSNSCTDITVTVTGGTGTKTYKVEGPYGTDIPLTSLPGGGVFTIDTSNVIAGQTISIVVTVYIDNGVEICTKKLTISYTRCACICDDDNTCKTSASGLTLSVVGGDPGFQRDIGVYQAGTLFNWYFDAQRVVDRLVIYYAGTPILDTGAVTRYSICGCDSFGAPTKFSCNCANLYLGEEGIAGQTINLSIGTATINAGLDKTCGSRPDFDRVQLLSGLVNYSMSGTIFLNPLIALQGMVTVDIDGDICESGGTSWTFGMTCG